MADFINTIDVLGDDAVMDSIIERTITEFKDDKIMSVGVRALCDCTELTTIDIVNAERIDDRAFENCGKLTSINLPACTTFGSHIFYNCGLRTVCLPSLTTMKSPTLSTYQFGNNKSLTYADFPVLTIVPWHMFEGCSSLTTLILRSSTLCRLGATDAFTSTPIASGTGYIYVPRALVDTYKAATNWSNYAAQFRALEDYTVDGTTTGELDETKI